MTKLEEQALTLTTVHHSGYLVVLHRRQACIGLSLSQVALSDKMGQGFCRRLGYTLGGICLELLREPILAMFDFPMVRRLLSTFSLYDTDSLH